MKESVVAVYDEIVNNQPVATQLSNVDDKVIRYIFNPLQEQQLSLLYTRLYGMTYIPAGIILPIREVGMIDQDFAVVGKLQVLDISEAVGVTERREFKRLPGVILRSMLAEYEESYRAKTGFREIKALIGNEDFLLARSMNAFLFKEREKKAEAEISRLKALYPEAADKGKLWKDVTGEVVESYEAALLWAQRHYGRLVKALDAFSNGRANGKAEVSPFDEMVCRWIGASVPRLQSKLAEEGKEQTVKVELVPSQIAGLTNQQIAPQDPALSESGPCPNCWRTIPYRNGQPAPLCFHCGVPTSELVQAAIAADGEEEDKVEAITPAATVAAEKFDPNNPMGEAKPQGKSAGAKNANKTTGETAAKK